MSFVAYSIYTELERVLKEEKYRLSVEKASELTHNMIKWKLHSPNQDIPKISS